MRRSRKAKLAEFRRHCEYWHRRFGLTDYQLIVEHRERQSDDTAMARVHISVDSRIATVKWFDHPEPVLSLRNLAKHEMLHVLLSDFVFTAASLRSNEHDDVIREEHKVIARLMDVIQ